MPSKSLLVKALKKATPAQLIRVRAIICNRFSGPGNTSAQWRKEEALKAFDKGVYGNQHVVYMLGNMDEELGQALR